TRATDTSSSSITFARTRGEEEYYGIREYRHGDSPRKIHWRRSARTGRLIIRETLQTGTQRLWCAVDVRMRSESAGASAALEQVIAAAATYICAALEEGASVGLISNGDPIVILPPANGRAHRPRLLRELALRTGHGAESLAALVRRHPWPARWQAPCVMFAVHMDDEARESAACLVRALGSARLYVPGTPAFSALVAMPSVLTAADAQPALPKEAA